MKRARLPQVVALLLAICSVVMFFVPLITVKGDGRQVLSLLGDMRLIQESEITLKELSDLSLFKLTKLLLSLPASGSDRQAMLVVAGMFASVGAFALLLFIVTLGKHPIGMLAFDVAMIGMYSFVTRNFNSSIMHSGEGYSWGIAHYAYYPMACLLAVCAIWLFIAKRKDKHAQV